MNEGRVNGLCSGDGSNFWTENQKIVQNYKEYHEIEKLLKDTGSPVKVWQINKEFGRAAGLHGSEMGTLRPDSEDSGGISRFTGINPETLKAGGIPLSVQQQKGVKLTTKEFSPLTKRSSNPNEMGVTAPGFGKKEALRLKQAFLFPDINTQNREISPTLSGHGSD